MINLTRRQVFWLGVAVGTIAVIFLVLVLLSWLQPAPSVQTALSEIKATQVAQATSLSALESSGTVTSTPTPLAGPPPPEKVLVTVERFVCEMADDEGTDNAVDMSLFQFAVNGNILHNWTSTNGYQEMNEGDVHYAGEGIEVPYGQLVLTAKVIDNDNGFTEDELGTSSLTLQPSQLLENNGKHFLYIYSDDFRFRVEITIAQSITP